MKQGTFTDIEYSGKEDKTRRLGIVNHPSAARSSMYSELSSANSVIKKVVYRGLKKNENRLYALFACANLYSLAIASRKLSTT